ncbi:MULTISPECIES: hypothetical protein [Helicobacter]|uniref:Uncharacterized protein n=1 Tax=Helicobacter ibis TaxID=2962633 RepID=A0ABT4VG95_9HELI|nr:MULTISPECIES: hypothetical protein [Helicobacter]MDA3967519.1 hypothetical protein [Helicobacter sp. WB40]MDA3969041.1 hypothetical protein [Helicobacter ibis]
MVLGFISGGYFRFSYSLKSSEFSHFMTSFLYLIIESATLKEIPSLIIFCPPPPLGFS